VTDIESAATHAFIWKTLEVPLHYNTTSYAIIVYYCSFAVGPG